MNYQEFFAKNREKVESEFVKRGWNEASGQPPEKLRENSYRFFAQGKGQEIMTRRAETMVYLLREGQIEVQPYELFADQLNHAQSMVPITWDHYNEVRGEIKEKLLPMEAAVEARAYTGEIDFGHTCPDWRALLELGYPGILRRLYAFLEKARSEKQRAFYHSCITVYEALEQWMLRLAEEAERKAGPDNALGLVAENLRNLTRRPPQTLHEALQLSFLSYFMQQELEQACVRSLGRFDLLYGPFYEADLQAGRLTREEAKALLQFYFCRWNARNITANIPITLCGTLNGREISSDFTRLVLEAYGELNIVSPKFHIRYSEALPADIEFQVLRLIRSGVSAFVFCSDAAVETALKSLGETAEDAEDYVMVGCYESTSMGREVACSCNGRLSFLKAVEYAMSGGMDLMTGRRVGLPTPLEYDTFEQFQEAVRAQLRWLADECMRRIALVERQYPQTFTTPFFSATMEACLEKGLDAYSGGARYNHSSINTFGIANAADAMSSIRHFVFEKKELTMREFVQILRQNWNGSELLRMQCVRFPEKYGVHHPRTDELARDLMHTAAERINGACNGRGGQFRMGAFSIDWRFEFGEHTAASADGRHAGDSLSKNLSACLGADREGVTALIESAASLCGSELPNGAVLDVVLHESAVSGDEGLNAMAGLFQTFMKKGGQAIQGNVLNAETLKQAQLAPEKYPTLQVRLCGWNVLFVNLSRKEQDELIRQAQEG